jgi:Tfp pilus assembly major pilin PilA
LRPDLERYSQIDQYLKNELSGEELAAFESELENSSDLQSLVESQRIANTLMLQHKLLQVKSKMKSDFQQSVPDKLVTQKWIRVTLLSILILSGITLLYWSFRKNDGSTATTLNSPVDKVTSQEASSSSAAINQDPVQRKNPTPGDKAKSSQTTVGNFTETTPQETQTKSIEEKSTVTNVSATEKQENSNVSSKPIENQVSCPGYKLSDNLRIVEGCEGKSENSISITLKDKKLKYSLNDQRFFKSAYFGSLDSGFHTIYLKDENGCVDSATVELKERKCQAKREYAFYPDRDERVSIPVDMENGDWTIKNRAGSMVGNGNVQNNQIEWDGKNSDGGELPIGLYLLEVKSEARNELFYITILK